MWRLLKKCLLENCVFIIYINIMLIEKNGIKYIFLCHFSSINILRKFFCNNILNSDRNQHAKFHKCRTFRNLNFLKQKGFKRNSRVFMKYKLKQAFWIKTWHDCSKQAELRSWVYSEIYIFFSLLYIEMQFNHNSVKKRKKEKKIPNSILPVVSCL